MTIDKYNSWQSLITNIEIKKELSITHSATQKKPPMFRVSQENILKQKQVLKDALFFFLRKIVTSIY